MIKPLPITGFSNQISQDKFSGLASALRPKLTTLLKQHNLQPSLLEPFQAAYFPICQWLHDKTIRSKKPLVVGICGAQGSGKTTLRRFAQQILTHGYGLGVAGFSLDDLYHTRLKRQKMGTSLHPLLSTRGVPGTHDLKLGRTVLTSLEESGPESVTALPLFNKAIDDRSSKESWPSFKGKPRIVLLDGWCLAAEPENEPHLDKPLNDLEQSEDPNGTWRRFVNGKLQTEYAQFFQMLDVVIFLQVPSFRWVEQWRWQQEQTLQRKASQEKQARVMTRDQLSRFIMSFERLTRLMLKTLPHKADLICRVDSNHHIGSIHQR